MDALTQLLADLVAVDSVNPSLVPGGAGEGEIARFMARWLAGAGLEVHVEEVLPGRPNVVAVARGKGGGKSLLLNGHIDTVGVEGMAAPHQPRIEGGRLYGRGGYDMKGGVAAAMMATARAAQLGLEGDVIFTGVMDEEHAGLGTTNLVERWRADAALVAEPTELELAVAHKGFVWFEVETRGVAAHGSRPHLGVDAIVQMGRFLTELGDLDRGLQAVPRHALLGGGSVHASLIAGGRELSTYPDRCLLSLERRTIPGQNGEMAEAELAEILARLAARDSRFEAKLSRGLERLPLETAEDHPFVAAARGAAETVLSRPAPAAGVSYWSDAATLAQAGMPTLLFGPTGDGAHAAVEWVDLASVETCAEMYVELARRWCG